MITGEVRSKVDQIWTAAKAGGIANPPSVIEQLTSLLFAKRLDELHTAREAEASTRGKLVEPRFAKKDVKNPPGYHRGNDLVMNSRTALQYARACSPAGNPGRPLLSHGTSAQKTS
ncbi:MAG: type I restriction-modification system subunit M N-terminal domain-containing protein [Gammaproteobacteria bacterium]